MPILEGDIKLLKSERMTDNTDGGGRITGNTITDGESNEIFNDVSDLDRVYGRTSLRKVFGAVETDSTDLYFGSHAIIDQAPDDENVSILAFSTDDATDERAEARNRLEGYVVAGPLSRLRLYGDQLEGQRTILAYQRVGETPPDIGDVILLDTADGEFEGEQQFVRTTSVETSDQVFTDETGDFTRQVVTIGISTALTKRFYGHEPMRSTAAQPNTVVRQTQVADSSRYYGVSKLASDAFLGSTQFKVQDVYQPIVPSTQTASPVTDVQVGGNVAVNITSGGITHEIPQIAETTSIEVAINNRGYSYTRNLNPLPSPGTVVVEYMALGKWYTISDEDGTGELTGSGTGQVNFSTGSVSITLQALPDVDTEILIYWGTNVHYVDRAGYSVPSPTPGLRFELNYGGVVPGTVTAKWVSGGTEVSATDDGKGAFSGNATGICVYGFQDNLNGDRVGEVWIQFADGKWPDGNSNVVVEYEYGDSDSATFNPSKDGQGYVQLQLPNAPLKPGSVAIEWEVYQNSTFSKSDTDWDLSPAGGKYMDDTYEKSGDTSGTVYYRAFDDGEGGIKGFAGSIDYDTGLVTLEVELVSEESTYSYSSENNRDKDVGWDNSTVQDVFSDGSAVIARWQPLIVNSTEDSVTRSPSPLQVYLMPLLQDSIVPGTLRFTFRGATYEDRDGALYRNVGSNGAGTYSGTVDYDSAVITLEGWDDAGSNVVNITSMVTVYGDWVVTEASFRTPGSPVQVGELSVLATTPDGELLSGQGDFSGAIVGDKVTGTVDYTTGVVKITFGELVLDSSLTTAEKQEYWYNPANVDTDGYIWKPETVLPSSCRFNTVILTSLPLDADLLGLDPVRLPSDGRVPIFRAANVAVIHHTDTTPWPMGTQAGDTLDVGRTRLALLTVKDSDGVTVPADLFTTDLDAGLIEVNADADLSGYTQPLYAYDRVEDMVLIGDVQINGDITIVGQLSHDYPADDTLVSSALIFGDLQARYLNVFDQTTWSNVWSDDLIGSEPSAQYNSTLYPIEVTDRGAITERWALVFNTTNTVRIIGESVGQIATDVSIESQIAPINPNTGVPYFVIDNYGWGSGWSVGNVLRFNTIGSNAPIWLARTVLQGSTEKDDFSFRIQVRGNVNRDPS